MKTFNASSRLTPTFTSPSRAIAQTQPESWLMQVWNGCQHLVESMVGDAEPQISHRVNSHGEVHWVAYDPQTGRSFSGSEAELRIWIEQRYYR